MASSITTNIRVDFTHPTRTKPTSIPGQFHVDFRLFDSIFTFNSDVTDVRYSRSQQPQLLTTTLALTDVYGGNNSIVFALNEIGLERGFHKEVIDALEDNLTQELAFMRGKGSFPIQLRIEAVVEIHRVSIEYSLPESTDSIDMMKCRELAMRGLVGVNKGEGLLIDDDDDETRSCAICLNELYNNIAVKLPNCRHVFHVSCVAKWFNKSQLCPLCRCSCLPS